MPPDGARGPGAGSGGGSGDPPAEVYARRSERFEARRQRAARRERRLVTARAAAFAVALGLGVGAEWTSGGGAAALWAGAASAAVAFAALVVLHRRARRREERAAALAELNRHALARLRRAWDDLPEPGAAAGPAAPAHPYASDLDLFGHGSVRALLGAVATSPGAARLRGWLLDAAHPERGPSPEETERRRRLVEALAPRLDVRDELAARGRSADPPGPEEVEGFLAWAEAAPWLPERPGVRWASWTLPAATWILAAAHLAGALSRPWWGLPVLATLYLAGRTSSAVHGVFQRAAAGEAALDRWAASLEEVAGLEGEPGLGELAAPLVDDGPGAPDELRRLDRLVHLAEARHGLAHFFLQVLFCWDVHVLRRLERWKARCGGRIRTWIDALARADALSALAALRHAHPAWAFPEIRDDGRAVRAEALGHPLLPPDGCVRNDVVVGPPGTFLFVTGSNMSGKSTLLRALGLNVVLARAGAPVCARRLRLPPLAVHTSVRVEDSVVRGVSQYMAELQRVRSVVAAARRLGPSAPGDPPDAGTGAPRGPSAAGDPPDAGAGAPTTDGTAAPTAAGRGAGPSPGDARPPRLLYLLDEPLQGTNEAERREAVRIILRALLASGAVGAVATHDLRLHEADGLREAARPVHFVGEVGGAEGEPALTFDYRLRDGPATSTNALDLLRLVGLGPAGGRDADAADGARDTAGEGDPGGRAAEAPDGDAPDPADPD